MYAGNSTCKHNYGQITSTLTNTRTYTPSTPSTLNTPNTSPSTPSTKHTQACEKHASKHTSSSLSLSLIVRSISPSEDDISDEDIINNVMVGLVGWLVGTHPHIYDLGRDGKHEPAACSHELASAHTQLATLCTQHAATHALGSTNSVAIISYTFLLLCCAQSSTRVTSSHGYTTTACA